MFLRPNLYNSYEQEIQILPTWTKKTMAAIGILILFLLGACVMCYNLWRTARGDIRTVEVQDSEQPAAAQPALKPAE